MVTVWTIVVTLAVLLIQGVLLNVVGIPVVLLFTYPSIMLSRGVEHTDAYAAKHPMRIHLIAWLLTWGRYLAEFILFGLVLLSLLWLSGHVDFWSPLPIGTSILLFLNSFRVARMGQSSWFHGASRRLSGESIEFFDSYASRVSGAPARGVLPPITPGADLSDRPDPVHDFARQQVIDNRIHVFSTHYPVERFAKSSLAGDKEADRFATLLVNATIQMLLDCAHLPQTSEAIFRSGDNLEGAVAFLAHSIAGGDPRYCADVLYPMSESVASIMARNRGHENFVPGFAEAMGDSNGRIESEAPQVTGALARALLGIRAQL